ncbi:MAG: Mth938-like domain-containing protein [Pseudomonadota bacterium]
MRLNEVQFPERPPIDGYGPGFFRIAGERHEGGVALTPSGVIAWTGLDDLQPLIDRAGEIDVLLIGMGAEIAPLPPAARSALEDAGIGVETMSSSAACRSYNVLLAEGRRVAAAVLPV